MCYQKIFLVLLLCVVLVYIQGCSYATTYYYKDMSIVAYESTFAQPTFYAFRINKPKSVKLYIKIQGHFLIKSSEMNRSIFEKFPNSVKHEESYGWGVYSSFKKNGLFYDTFLGDLAYSKNIYSLFPTLRFKAFYPRIISVSVDGINFYDLPLKKSTIIKLFGMPEYVDSYEVPSI